jgi:hypothetical protein
MVEINKKENTMRRNARDILFMIVTRSSVTEITVVSLPKPAGT